MSPEDSSQQLTPLMRQYYSVKTQHPDKILFFRMGDFYEMFDDDALKAAPILGIALTSRSQGEGEKTPLAGVPYHSAERYLSKLLDAGLKVVVVEQVEDPRKAKGLVKREIVEIITPGTTTFDTGESADRQSRMFGLAAICAGTKRQLGLACLDLSTGRFLVDQGEREEIIERMKVLEPAEILLSQTDSQTETCRFIETDFPQCSLTKLDDWQFEYRTVERDLNRHFGVTTLEGFGVGETRLGVSAAGAIFNYLKQNQRDKLTHIQSLSRFDHSHHMALDYSTVRNLELVKNSQGGVENSLFQLLNTCHTAGGSRKLHSSLLRPFTSREKIELRQSGVTELVLNQNSRHAIRQQTKQLPDLERSAGRLGIGRISPRQLQGLGEALATASRLRELTAPCTSSLLNSIHSALPDTRKLSAQIAAALVDSAPLLSTKGNIFREGYSPQLDGLNSSIRDARLYIASLQAVERDRTGINTLKVGYNQIFGYYLEVTRANAQLVPPEYQRKQTLVNAERYITPELKEKEELIAAAEEKIFALEEQLYSELVQSVTAHMADILQTAELLSELDLVSSLAELAVSKNYVQPEIFEDSRLTIVNGRHPVIESVIPSGQFVGNDTSFIADCAQIHILTGPNMSGKSTYLRQIGLIVLMAQMGSYVPADSAQIGLVDRVFTRVGALDNLARGQSTFLVEMVETANILHNATSRSLVLLDEVGRGTSTFDGLSVAWSVVEFLNDRSRCRTIFATHYHELTGLADLLPSVANYQVCVKKWNETIVFLHKIIPGGCDDSYGIEVARLAGVPRECISRAKQILKLLESGKFAQSELGKGIYLNKVQPSFFEVQKSPLEKALIELDLDSLAPREAVEVLRRWQEEIRP